MTTNLFAALSSNHRAQTAEYKKYGYLLNGWDKLRRWDGRSSALELAGIAGPDRTLDSWQPAPTEAAGACTEGLHVVRYRHLDPNTGYVSNPSEEREVTVTSGNGQLTFPINDAGAGVANIIRSTDAKATRIVVEMTLVSGSTWFTAGEVDATATQIVISISDAALEVSFLPYPEFGHDEPPLAKNVVSHRDRLWLFSQVTHSTGNCNVTNGSPDVAEGATDPDWRASALGDSTATPATSPSVTWLFQVDGDARAYEVSTYDESLTKIILKENYAGTTATGASYKLFSRANVIWVSEPSYPEGFSPLTFLQGPNGEMTGDITAGVGHQFSMIFFSNSSMFKLTWDQGPLVDPVLIPLSSKYGALNQRVVIEVEGQVYSMDRSGWVQWSGVFPQFASQAIDDVRASIDYSLAHRFHACWFPEQRAVRWHVCYKGDAYPKNYVQLDVDTGAWSTGSFLQGISDSRLAQSASGLRVYYGDENGHTWIADNGTVDGCAPEYSHLTMASGTAAIPETNESLPGDNGLAGCVLTWLNGSAREHSLIVSNTQNAITLLTPLSALPAQGDTFWVGAIPSKLKTKAFSGGGAGKKKRTRYLWVEFEPVDSTRYAQLRAYEDLSSTQKTMSQAGNNLPGLVRPGVDSRYPANDFLLDMSESDGAIEVGIGMEWRRYFEIELEILEPDAPIEILALEHDGTVTGSQQ